MRARSATALVLAGVLWFPTAAAGASSVSLPECGSSSYGGEARPKRWDGGCTGNLDLRNARWSSWGGSVARGTGIGYDGGRTTITAYRIRTCEDDRGRKRRFYTRVRLDDAPVQKLGCLR